MKKCRIRTTVFVVFGVILLLALFQRAAACPMFVEFFPDPKDVPDQEGEFLEIRLDDFMAETLWVQMEDKAPLSFLFPRGKRLVLVHDSVFCPKVAGTSCGLLGKLSLPNSRESFWQLRAEGCSDSVAIPLPKAGLAIQRVMASDKWDFVSPTMGYANPGYEDGVKDCGLSQVQRDRIGDSVYRYSLFLTGCDSAMLRLETTSLDDNRRDLDSFMIVGSYSWQSTASSIWIRGQIPTDEAPSNNVVDSLLLNKIGFPLALSEVHHCSPEPEPEWVEVYNRSGSLVPLSKFYFCNRGGVWGDSLDFIEPYEAVVFSKDTSLLRDILGYRDVRLIQVSLGYLNNTEGCLSICNGNSVVDSVCWDRHTVSCPSGFNPLTMKAENTPGFIKPYEKQSKVDMPFSYKLSSRIFRTTRSPLRVYVEGKANVDVRLLDSAGREQWHITVPSQFNNWVNVPLHGLSVGVAYVSLSAGRFENVVGILIRP